MKKYQKILKKCSLFDGIEEESLHRMLHCLGARVIELDEKYTLFAEGSAAKYIALVLSGRVQVVQMDYYGNRSILAEAGPGELVGDEFACAEVDSIPVSVIATEACEVMLLDCSHILYTCSNACGFHHRLIYNLMKGLAKKSLDFHRRIEITSKRSTREKLLAYLAACAREAGRDSFEIPFDRQELADYLEVDRSGLSAEIGKLRREGVIDTRKNWFRLY